MDYKTISLRVTGALCAKVKRKASDKDKTLSAFIRELLEKETEGMRKPRTTTKGGRK